MKLLIIILLGLSIFIVGCSDNTPHGHEVDAYTRAEIDAKTADLSSRLDNLEANQISADDILALTDFNEQTITLGNISNLTQGCPSDYDVDVKWFDALGDGYISQSQYNKIVDKWNECNG